MAVTQGTPLLTVEGLAAGYGALEVVHDVDLRVDEGEIVAVLGANGAGKTTTILTIAGILSPLGGTVRLLGFNSSASLSERARAGLSVVTDSGSVFLRLTVAENLRVFKVDDDRLFALFPELRPHIDRRVGLLSGGQQQMLSLGLALARQPRLIVADELSHGLAPAVVQRLFGALRAAAGDGVGILLVEQQMHSALAVADRAYIMDGGRIVRSGSAVELQESFSRPRGDERPGTSAGLVP